MQKHATPSTFRQHIVRLYVLTHIVLGGAVLFWGFLSWQPHDQLRFMAFLGTAAFASVLKVRLPGVSGIVSVSALFILIGLVNLSLPETLAMGALSMLIQCTWRTATRPKPLQVSFNIACVATAIYLTAHLHDYLKGQLFEPLSLALLAATYYVANSFPIASIIAITEGKRIPEVWSGYRWMLPYYVVGASMAWLIHTVPYSIQWELPMICMPIVYLVHRSNRTYMAQVEQEKKHAVEMNGLHLRTIEALALAIDAKDHTTHDHLQRVQLYAVEIGRDLGLTEVELEALRVAAMLHDIGKLAVPEHIISKPGKLTRDEFDKMKTHPVVGAEILERVRFPYPVVPIVQAHHEKWDGSGYPYGLAGKDIPVGARILSAVDCLDALASDRQYRRALPLDEAMAKVASESGTSFDPAVIQALQARYRELEGRAKAQRVEAPPALSKDIKITRGSAPAAGFAVEGSAPVHPVARARASNIVTDGRVALRSEEALAVLALRLKGVVPYDSIAFFCCEAGEVRPKFVAGDDHRRLGSLLVPIGEGLVGWVAEIGKPILNGNPTIEPGYGTDSPLGSALAMPLRDSGRVVGVLALYRAEKDAFMADELVALLPACTSIASYLQEVDTSEAIVTTSDATSMVDPDLAAIAQATKF